MMAEPGRPDHGADVAAGTNNGRTALMLAAAGDHAAVGFADLG